LKIKGQVEIFAINDKQSISSFIEDLIKRELAIREEIDGRLSSGPTKQELEQPLTFESTSKQKITINDLLKNASPERTI